MESSLAIEAGAICAWGGVKAFASAMLRLERFCCIPGSGTGYFNSIIADLTGNLAVNHGIDVWPETVAHAQERCAILDKDHIEFTTGNIYQLDVSKTIRYDRVYVVALVFCVRHALPSVIVAASATCGSCRWPFGIHSQQKQLEEGLRHVANKGLRDRWPDSSVKALGTMRHMPQEAHGNQN
eukprot:5147080-Amphidinium_carterae.1